jgi:hypothetical protein
VRVPTLREEGESTDLGSLIDFDLALLEKNKGLSSVGARIAATTGISSNWHVACNSFRRQFGGILKRASFYRECHSSSFSRDYLTDG